MNKYVEVDGSKFVDDGKGSPKLDADGNRVPFVEEHSVPYERFKEVNDKLNTLKEEISSLKSQKRSDGLSPEEEKELQAKTYLEKLTRETLDKVSKEKSEAETREQKEFEKEVGDILLVNTDVKRAEFLDFIDKKADSYGIKSVEGAMKLYRDINNLSKEGLEKAKKELQGKPGFPSSEGKPSSVPAEDKGKSIHQIAAEV